MNDKNLNMYIFLPLVISKQKMNIFMSINRFIDYFFSKTNYNYMKIKIYN